MKQCTCLFFMIIFVVLFSCKISNTANRVAPYKKNHIMERTQWKHSSGIPGEPDVLLDFYTVKHVQEYLILPNGTTTKANLGTYKIKNQRLIKIKWNEGKYSFENITGRIDKNILTLTEKFNEKEFHKIKDY